MTLWRVEWLRLWRARTLWLVLGVFVFFGALGPAKARFLPEIVERAGIGGDLGLPPPSPEFAMAQYVGNALQIGFLAVAFVSATSLAFDSKSELSAFYCTRATVIEILAPRYAINSAVSTMLIGAPGLPAVLAGSALMILYLVFAVSLVGLMASLVPSVPGAALLAVGTLIVLAMVGLLPHVGAWLPSYLVGGFDALIAGGEFEYWRASIVTAFSTCGAVGASVILMGRREV